MNREGQGPETTPRQLLYALVAAGFLLVVATLILGAAASALAPGWWSLVAGVALVCLSIWVVLNWRRTAPVLGLAIGSLLVWSIVTLLVS